jgi:hypothetical protein
LDLKGRRGGLYITELYSLCSPSNIVRTTKSRGVRWEGQVSCMGEMRSTYRKMTGKPEGKRTLERLSHRWEDNIKMHPKKMRSKGVKWIHLIQHNVQRWALVNMVMNLQVP